MFSHDSWCYKAYNNASFHPITISLKDLFFGDADLYEQVGALKGPAIMVGSPNRACRPCPRLSPCAHWSHPVCCCVPPLVHFCKALWHPPTFAMACAFRWGCLHLAPRWILPDPQQYRLPQLLGWVACLLDWENLLLSQHLLQGQLEASRPALFQSHRRSSSSN
jgi:hypothetical protein